MSEEQYIKTILESFGFLAKKLPESQDSSPDFLVTGEKDKYLIELKTKFDDPAEIADWKETLNRGEIAEKHDTTSRKNTISKRIRESADQLESITDTVDLRLVWLLAVDRYQEMKLEQFRSTLYGNVGIFDLDESSGNLIPCYYFDFNEFYSTSNTLDGAIISTVQNAIFCFNTFSPNYRLIKASEIAKKFGKAVCDPLVEELAGDAFVMDTDIDRRDEGALIKYLNKKYGRNKLQAMRMGFHSATIEVPKQDG